jgi:hypothetical protein
VSEREGKRGREREGERKSKKGKDYREGEGIYTPRFTTIGGSKRR